MIASILCNVYVTCLEVSAYLANPYEIQQSPVEDSDKDFHSGSDIIRLKVHFTNSKHEERCASTSRTSP